MKFGHTLHTHRENPEVRGVDGSAHVIVVFSAKGCVILNTMASQKERAIEDKKSVLLRGIHVPPTRVSPPLLLHNL